MHQPFPVREFTLMYFVAWAFQQGLSGGTVKNYLAAVRHSHISLGLGDSRIGWNAAIGVRGERIIEKGPESSTNAAANYGRNLGGLAMGVAAPSRVTGCSHAVGSGSNVFFFWFLAIRRGYNSQRRRL